MGLFWRGWGSARSVESVDPIRTCALVLAFVLLASGCGGGSDSAELEALREKVEALEAQTTTVAPTTTAVAPTTTTTTTQAVATTTATPPTTTVPPTTTPATTTTLPPPTTTTTRPPDPLVISTGSIPGGTTGGTYFVVLRGAGGVPPRLWLLDEGSLPSGLELLPSAIITDNTSKAACS